MNLAKKHGSKTTPSPSFECILMDTSTSSKTNRLQGYFALYYSNADTGAKPCTYSMDHKDHYCNRTRFTDESCFTIPLVDDHEIQVLKSNE